MDLHEQFVLYRTIYMGCPLQRAKLLQTCSKTFILIDRDRREDSLVINQSGSDTYSTVRFHQLGKHPCMHLRWMPNGYIGLYLIKKWCTLNLRVTTWQPKTTQLQLHIKGREVLRWQDKRWESIIKEKKQVPTEERESEQSASLFHRDHFVNNWCHWF